MTVLERLKELEAKAKSAHVAFRDSPASLDLYEAWQEAAADLDSVLGDALPHLIAVAEAVEYAYRENGDMLIFSPEQAAALAELTKGAGDER